MNKNNLYPIKFVSLKTGLTLDVIRVWEKRYNAVTPVRTETNRRMYTDQDIEKLLILKKGISQGRSIGQIAELNLPELKELIIKDELLPLTFDIKDEVVETGLFLKEALDCVKDLNAKGLEFVLHKAQFILGNINFLEKLMVPLIAIIGDKWKSGELRISHEHMASSVIHNILGNIINSSNVPKEAISILITTPSGQVHELGALIFAAIASIDGFRVIYLGANLPVEEIIQSLKQSKSKILALSIVYPLKDPKLVLELKKLGDHKPDDILLIAGGRAVQSYQEVLESIGTNIITSIKDFRDLIENYNSSH